MSNYVHIKAEYYPRGESRKQSIKIKVDAERWDNPRFNRISYINGHLQRAAGIGARLQDYKETRRTKT
jgi:hypothetical protein